MKKKAVCEAHDEYITNFESIKINSIYLKF